MRYAVVRGESTDIIAGCLPTNYRILHIDQNGAGVLIGGEDVEDWTLEDSVIPSLQGGQMQAKEVWPCFISEPVGSVRNIELEMDVPNEWIKVPV